MKKVSKIVAKLLLCILAITSLTACGKQESSANKDSSDTTTITIGYLPITHALAVFQEKEMLEKADADIQIKLQKFGSWTDLTDALNAGKIDGASMLIELAMSAVSKGIDLKAVALGHKDGNVVVVSKDIEEASDLKGKTFAIPSNQSSHYILLNDALKKAGLTIDDVKVTQLSPGEMPSSLASGAIDGYCVAEPFGAQAVVQGYGHVLFDSEELWDQSVCCALVLNQSFINKNEDATKEFVTQYYEAGKTLTKESAETIAKKYLGQSEETLKASLEWIHFDQLEITKDDYQVLTDKVKSYGVSQTPPSYEEFVYQVQ